MKKTLLVFLIAVSAFSPALIKAQNYSIAHDTVYATIPTSSLVHDDITNLTGAAVAITYSVIATDFPSDWLTPAAFGICDNFSCRNNTGNSLWNPSTSTGTAYTASYGCNATHNETEA